MLKKTVLSVAVVVASMGIFVAPSMADVSFCVATPTPINMQALTSNEVGVVIAPTSNTGNPVVKANNNYGQGTGAGGYWTSNTSTPATLTPNCYILSISAKASQPSGGNPWYCAAETTSQTPNNLNVVGTVTYSSTLQAQVASVYILGQTTALNTNAGNANCPPPGQ